MLKTVVAVTQFELFLCIGVGFVMGRAYFGTPQWLWLPVMLIGVPILIHYWRRYCGLDHRRK